MSRASADSRGDSALTVVHVTIMHRPLDVRIFDKECRTLAEAGYDVHLAVHGAANEVVSGVVLHEIPLPSSRVRGLRGVQRLRSALVTARALRPMVCHLHDAELIPVGIVLKRGGVRVVYDAHEDRPRQIVALAGTSRKARVMAYARSRAISMLERLAGRVFDGFIAATPTIGQRFPPRRTAVVRNLPRLEEFDSAEAAVPYRDRPNILVYAGGLSTARGLREMAKAIDLVPPRLEARLLLLGEPTNEEAQLELARLAERREVEITGWQSRPALVRRLLHSKIGLLLLHPTPNYLPSLPIKLFEYMAAGLPVVASDFPRWREIVEVEQCGLLVDPLDPNAIAEAVRFLLQHPDEAEQMGDRGRRAVEERYEWSSEEESLLGFYRGVLSR